MPSDQRSNVIIIPDVAGESIFETESINDDLRSKKACDLKDSDVVMFILAAEFDESNHFNSCGKTFSANLYSENSDLYSDTSLEAAKNWSLHVIKNRSTLSEKLEHKNLAIVCDPYSTNRDELRSIFDSVGLNDLYIMVDPEELHMGVYEIIAFYSDKRVVVGDSNMADISTKLKNFVSQYNLLRVGCVGELIAWLAIPSSIASIFVASTFASTDVNESVPASDSMDQDENDKI